jgi:hypothetical protein
MDGTVAFLVDTTSCATYAYYECAMLSSISSGKYTKHTFREHARVEPWKQLTHVSHDVLCRAWRNIQKFVGACIQYDVSDFAFQKAMDLSRGSMVKPFCRICNFSKILKTFPEFRSIVAVVRSGISIKEKDPNALFTYDRSLRVREKTRLVSLSSFTNRLQYMLCSFFFLSNFGEHQLPSFQTASFRDTWIVWTLQCLKCYIALWSSQNRVHFIFEHKMSLCLLKNKRSSFEADSRNQCR